MHSRIVKGNKSWQDRSAKLIQGFVNSFTLLNLQVIYCTM